jgi:hypothetical protein
MIIKKKKKKLEKKLEKKNDFKKKDLRKLIFH